MRKFTNTHRENLRKAALIAQNRPEQKVKISLSKKGKKNFWWGKKWNKKRRKEFSHFMKKHPVKYWLGKKQSKEHIEKRFRNRKNFKHTLETKLKIGKANSGKNQWNWKGGVTPLFKKIRFSFKYKLWRSDVFKRDDWTCLTCRKRGGNLEVHHIKKFYKIIEENKIKTFKKAMLCKELWNLNNGITLCKECHLLTKRRPKYD